MTSQRLAAGRADLLLAAAELFATQGFAGTSTAEVARRAGVTQPLVHHHFRSKKGLWDAVVTDLFTALDATLEQAACAHANASEEVRLREMLRAFVRFCGQRPHLSRLIRIEGNGSEFHEELHNRWLDRFVVFFRELIDKAVKSCAVRPVAVEHLYFFVVGACTEPFAQPAVARRAFGLDVTVLSTIEQHADLVVDVIFEGLRPR